MTNTLQKIQAVRTRARWVALLCITLLAFAVPSLYAQVDQGAVTGVVTDPTGAAIPNATVSLTNTDTGFVQEQNTDASGIYTFSPVKIGRYMISATAAGGSAHAIKIGDPFKAGGSGPSCASSVRNRTHWYNPCAFTDPLPGSNIAAGQLITDSATALKYLGGRSLVVSGPGYWRTDMSLFKDFAGFREHKIQLRADAFNLFNHPTWSNPSTSNTSVTGGLITGTKSFQANTPDARFMQVSAKYIF